VSGPNSFRSADPVPTPGRAEAYAAWARSGRDVSFEPTFAALIDLLPPSPLNILDVGCGEGRVGRELIKRGYAVIGVDFDARMVELAREQHEAVVAPATHLPFAKAAFSCVITVHALMEVDDLERAVNEISRVVEPGGPAVAIIEHPFASAPKVARYSERTRYTWAITYDGADVGLSGIHRPLGDYVSSFEAAGLTFDTLREISVRRWDPMSLAIRAHAPASGELGRTADRA
jgi:SAM-dependent methyltransferase